MDEIGWVSKKKQKVENLNKNELSVLIGDTKIIIKINENDLVGKLL